MTTSSTPPTETPETELLDVRELLKTMTAPQQGDFYVRLPIEWTGMAGKISDIFNQVMAMTSDYITKPVDTEQLPALMRTWLN